MKDATRKQTILYILIFSLLVTAVAWMSPLLGGSPESPGFGFIIWGAAPMLISLLIRGVTYDWSDLGARPAIRKNARWYILSVLAYPVAMILAVVAGSLVSASSVVDFSMDGFLQIMLPAFIAFFFAAIFEEVGWRGYLVPKLASLGVNSYVSAVLVGIVWASWHLPYIRELTWDHTSEDLLTFIPRFYLACIAFSLVFGEIRMITGTFWTAVLMHAIGNAFGHPLAAKYVEIATGKEYLGSVGNGLFIIAFMFLVGVAINLWRRKQASHSDL